MRTCFFLFLFSLIGCVSTQSQKEQKMDNIWFEGSVEEAFNRSKQLDKPLFLYWGAVWCPP